MKVLHKGYRDSKPRTKELWEIIEKFLTEHFHMGVAEDAATIAKNNSRLLAQLIDKLHEKELLDIDDVRELLNENADNLMDVERLMYTIYYLEDETQEESEDLDLLKSKAESKVGNDSYSSLPDGSLLYGPGDGTTAVVIRKQWKLKQL